MKPLAGARSLEATLQGRLAERESQGRLRRLDIPRSDLVDFSSNDYLSLSRDLVVRDALLTRLNHQKSPLSPSNERIIGSGGSRLLDGNSALAEHLEQKIAAFHDSQAALLFNSAYDANVGLISCVPGADDVILYDNLIHASIHDGMRLSRATRRFPFTHDSIVSRYGDFSVKLENHGANGTEVDGPQSLERTLKKLTDSDRRLRLGESNVFICTEALYSMDGDIANLEYVSDLVELLLPYGNGYIIVDEAHSIGVLGDGRGLVCQLGLPDRIWARVIGFGKAMGCAGGGVLCSSTTRLYLVNYARTLIYTTAMSFPSLASIETAYDYMMLEGAKQRRCQLKMLIQHCYAKLRSLEERSRPTAAVLRLPKVLSSSPIIPLFTNRPKSLAQYCQTSGFMVRPIVAPTVPQGQERVRICVHASNTIEQVDGLCQAIETWMGHVDIERHADSKGESQSHANMGADLSRDLWKNRQPKL